jgi:hypothetical protein
MTAESILVGIIVAFCAAFSGWRLMSVRLRLKTLDALSGIPGIASLRRRTLAKMSGGCGACQSAVNVNARSSNQRPAAPHH